MTESVSFDIRPKGVFIYVPGKKKYTKVGEIRDNTWVWNGVDEAKHTISIGRDRCFGIDLGFLKDHLVPNKMKIELRNRRGDTYSISAEDAYEHGIVKQFKKYGWQCYIPMECFLLNGKPFNES